MQISAKQCSFRKLRKHELEDALRLFMRSFRRSEDESLYRLTKKHWTDWQTSHLAVFYGAFFSSKLVGLCLCFAFKTTASLGYMVVDIDNQHKGIGTSLLGFILSELEQRGIKTVRLYATKMGEHLYKKFDFHEDCIGSIYEMDFHEEINPRSLRVRVSNRILPWVYSLDKAVYGDDRTPLLRFLIKNGQLLVKGRLGFAFVRKGIVGPIVTKNIPVFIDLLKFAYTKGARKLYYLTHDNRSRKLIEIIHLIEKTSMRCNRMVRGEHIKEDLKKFYALYNFAIG